MKNQKCILHSVAVLAVAALATACSNEDELTDKTSGNKEAVTITAYQPNTRVGFDKDGNGYWQAGDEIGVWSNGESEFSSFTIDESGVGKASATFSGTVTGGIGQYAVYPYNNSHKLSDNTLTYYLPSSYTYTSVDQTFLPEKKNGNSFCMPMYGTIENNNVSFKHLGGVICLKIDKMPAESGTVTVTEASNKLCGTFSANLTDTNPEIKTAESSADKSVTFTYSGATTDQPGIFYLPVAVGEYTLTVTVAGGEVTNEVTTKALKMERGHLKKVNITLGSKGNSKKINGHMFIDLGLPSGLLWAETNIGAETAYDDGNYYAWGETTTKSSYSLNNYAYYVTSSKVYTKYNRTDGKKVLEAVDDAAYKNWGPSCRMPTQSELEELINSDNCTRTWVSGTNSAGENINCYKFVSKKNGNIIYLPASGLRTEGSLSSRSYGHYWSSTVCSTNFNSAYYLYFGSGDYYGIASGDYSRSIGRNVRPVAEP